MRKKWTILIAILLSLSFILASGSVVFASNKVSSADDVKKKIEEQKKKIEQLNRELEELTRELNRLAAQKGGIYSKLYSVQQQIKELEAKQEQLASEVDELDARLKRLEVDKNLYLKKVDEKRKDMAIRVLAWYKYSKYGWTTYLGNIRNFTEFMRDNYEMMLVVDMDRNILAEYTLKVQKLKEIESQIVALREERQKKIDELNKIVAELEPQYKEYSRIYTSLSAEYSKNLAKKRKLIAYKEKEEQVLYQLLALLEAYKGDSKFTGFIWPMTGVLTAKFGWRIHPIYHTKMFHYGIDIAAPFGTPIKAAASGIVAYAGWFGGYGYTVILAHPNGFYTLYAHLSKYIVREGQKVYQGQVIAYEGSTGWSTGPHLHFAIYRKIGGKKEFVDPLKYLPPMP
ncbi:MAG: peptidoglycan DD-metalloendopeptidase family protein [Dictyoglomi bacterium]|nr:peptidoglycan DD-metalloendopeptidase family protein [Dictyoglomota bacterium]